MTKNKNARSTAATVEQAEGTGLATKFPCANCSTHNEENPLISDLLHAGAENALTLSELVQLTGEDERSIRRCIQRERKAGKLILSDNQSGYFLPSSEHEVRRFIRSMSNRAREIAAVSRAAEDALERVSGQSRLRGW